LPIETLYYYLWFPFWGVLGPLSSVWKEWLKWCVEFGIEANAIIAAPYDWRLAPSKLQERDLYFHKLK
jgi:Lecithin:cholesterol acyltransferase